VRPNAGKPADDRAGESLGVEVIRGKVRGIVERGLSPNANDVVRTQSPYTSIAQ
jgi:hypothetical protein